MGKPKGKKTPIASSCGLCDQPDNNNMVCCDQCDVWYHFKCVGIKRKDLGDKWHCMTCKKQSANAKKPTKHERRQTSPVNDQYSDERPPNRTSDHGDKRSPSPETTSKDKRHTDRQKTPLSQVSRHSRSPSRSVRQSQERISSILTPPAGSYLDSIYSPSQHTNWSEKQRIMAIEMDRIEEERRLNSVRDREYLDQKYRILANESQGRDEVETIRRHLTGAWVDYHSEKATSSTHKSPSEYRSVKSVSRKPDESKIDKSPPTKFYQKSYGACAMTKCVTCELAGEDRTFVTCCLCNRRGHIECLEIIVNDDEVLRTCLSCKTTIPPVMKEHQADNSKKFHIETIRRLNIEPGGERCRICNKIDNKPFRDCDVCDKSCHYACMELARVDNTIIWICPTCIGPDRTQPKQETIPVTPVTEQPLNQTTNVTSDTTRSADIPDIRGSTIDSNRANLTSLHIASRHVIAKDLPYFSGKPEDWPIFISRYDNSTKSCAFSNAENLDRLQRCLKGHALEAVRSRLNIPESVPDIIETLRLLYGRPELIINSLLTKIRQQAAPKADKLDTLIDFALAVKNLSATMEQTGLTEYSSNPALILELIEKLPTNTKIEWAKYKAGLGERRITLKTLGDWLYRLAEVISTVTQPTYQGDKPQHDRVQNKAKSNDKKDKEDDWFNTPNRTNVHQQNYYSGAKSYGESSSSASNNNVKEICSICKKSCRHVEECPVFKSFNPEQRWKSMIESKLCRKCLRRHNGLCKSTKICGINGCSCKHHRLLHDQNKHSEFTKESTVAQATHNVHVNSIPHVFYRIVPVTLYNDDKVVRTLAYLDEGSDLTLMERQVAEELNLIGVPERLCLLWTAKVHRFEEQSTIVNLEISGQNEFTRKFKLLGVRTVEDLGLPEQTIDREAIYRKCPFVKGIPLIEYRGTPRILIGLANANLCTQTQILEGNEFEPIVSRSKIGWSIHGPTRQPNKDNQSNKCQVLVCQKHENEEIYHRLVKEHFTVENFGVQINNNLNVCSKEDERAIQLLQQLTKRTENGFETGLLFKSDFVELPDSYQMAKRRLICLEKQKSSKIQAIDDRIKEYIAKGYVSKLDPQTGYEENQRIWYLPIFTVVYPKKPDKIRLVFDAAAEVNGISLNKVLLKGPDQLSSLVDILRRFREKSVAINGDIKEMFHQVVIRKEDRQLQRFLWRNGDDSREPEIYVLNVMTFGAKCSPSSAQFVKNTNAKEFEEKYPQAVASIIDNHYVDDMMDGAHTEEEAIRLVKQVQEIHRHGGFEITKFISNSSKVMDALGSKCKNENKSLDVDVSLETERVLGMYWNTELDCFTFSLKFTKIHQDVVDGTRYPTKRELLKTLMSIFDPLGLLSQYLVHLKILLQDVWRSDMKWDDQLVTEAMRRAWDEWFNLLPDVERIQIPRLYSPKISPGIPTSIELHTFVDAGEAAFSAVVYLRIEDEQGVDCVLVGSKVRVAPLKYMSIPRKELQAGVLGTRLAINIERGQRLKIDRKVYWTDSSTLLSWIKSDHRKYHQFVAHRIGEILEATESDEWRWVPSKQNVADDATKASNFPNLDIGGRWYRGPDFIRQPESEWPCKVDIESNTPEEMKIHCLHSHLMAPRLIQVNRFSNWNRMVRALAYVIRFVRILRSKVNNERISGPLTQYELAKSRNLIFRQAQFENYPDEMVTLERNKVLPEAKRKPMHKSSSLINCLPYLDTSNVLRVRGRIGSNVDLPDDVKRPIILPRFSKITRLLVECYHRMYHHRSHETVVNEMRQKFYIPRIRVLLRSVRINDCQLCKVRKSKPETPQMGSLPPARLALGMRPFSYSGIDYFGPILVTCGRTERKRWGVLITCLTIRAVHIEIAHSLDTNSTIMCIRNFMNRRGRPTEFYSDCGTNLKGADNELRDLVANIDSERLAVEFTTCYTKWCFNPPKAASMGGSWERLVRSVKTCLYDIMPTRNPKDDVLTSLLLEVENVVNSRPLTFVPLDYEDDEALTPNHFLIGSSNGMKAPFEVDIDGPYLRSAWREVQRLTEIFWKRFVKEYVPMLHERTKWHHSVDPIQPGDVVVIYDDDNPRNTYPKAKVLEVSMGSNNQVRRVKIQKGDARRTILWRPAYRLARLDVYKEPTDGSFAAIPGSIKTGGSVTAGHKDDRKSSSNSIQQCETSDEDVKRLPEEEENSILEH